MNTAVAFFPDGRRALSAGSDGTLKVWDLGTGACLHTLDRQSSETVQVLAVLPDGRRAIAAQGNTLKIWDMEAFLPANRAGTSGWVAALALHPDGQRAISGG